ncbi:MAG: hypothetical protein KAV25_01915 [Methanophagales archaeon]|nr:hypothetical protein [Methanophagales archaeon]
MKKVISIGIIGVIVSAMLLAAIPSVSAKLWGDANGDGKINMGDVTFVERIIVWLEDETELADANQDGNINRGDVTYIELIILGRAPFPGGTLVVGTMWDPSTSPGAENCGGVSPYGTNLYEPLVFVDNDMNVQPGLAKSWKQLDDDTWRFYLREGVKFHDGTTFDADAVKFIFDKALDDPFFSMILKTRLYIESKDQIDVVDDYTIDISTSKPLGCLPGRLANPGLVMVSPEMDDYGKPDGTGPFKFEKMTPLETLEVVRNEQYWGDSPKLEKLTIKTIFDPSTKVMALEAGEVDLIYGVPRAEVSSLKSDPDIQVFEKMLTMTSLLRANANRELLNDVRVRKAINYAINKEDIVEYICESIEEPAKSCIPPVISWSADDELDGYSYNPTKAEQLLAEAGWADTDGDGYLDKDGETLEIGLTYVPGGGMGFPLTYEATAEAIQDQLKDIGIKVELEPMEAVMYTIILLTGQFDLLMDYWSAWDGDASHLISDYCHLESMFSEGLNLTAANQALVDELIDVALTTSDPDIIEENYREVQKIVVDEEAAVVPLVYEYEVVAAWDNVKEFEIHPLTAWSVTMKEVYNTE